MTSVHAAVEEAVRNFLLDDESELELRPKLPSEWSVLFGWGVRVYDKNYKPKPNCPPTGQLGWICLGSQWCRDARKFYPYYGDKTTYATRHLKEAHGVVASKTETAGVAKRSREEEIELLSASPLFASDPARLRQLLETRRVVFNSLPFVFGEYDDSLIINKMFVQEKFRATLNRRTVSQCIIEMYASAQREAARHIKRSVTPGVSCLTMVCDFWTCPTQRSSYLGVRAYFVDDV
jgi:hypothetical protein